MTNPAKDRRFETSSELIRSLNSVLLRQRLVLFLAGALLTVAALLAAWIILALVANVTVLPVWLKLTLLIAAGGVTAYLFFGYALRRLFGGSVDSVALALEERYPDLKGRLVAAVQFSRRALRSGYSPDLVRATERQALERAGHIDFGSVISFNPVFRTGRAFLAAAAIAVGTLIVAPGLFQYAVEVYANPTTKIAPPVAYELVATPGSTEWIKYRDLTLGGALVGHRLPEKATVNYRLAGGNWQRVDIDLRTMGRAAIPAGDSLQFGTTIRQVYRSVDYYVEAGDRTTPVYQIDVVDRPRVTGINVSIFYPDYTGLEPLVIDELNGSFSALVGSRVNLKLETNLPVETAAMIFEDGSRAPLAVGGSTAEVSLLVEKSGAYRFELVDHLGEHNPDPIEYYITAVPDEYPSIDVVRPGFDVNLGDEMILPLLVRIFDDYGFSSLVMKFQTVLQGRQSEEHVAVLHFSDKIKTEGDVEFNWDMDRLNLFPGDYVSYYFEVADNDRISGPKLTRSRKYIARVPSLEEIVKQSEKASEERIARTEELVKQGKELAKRLKEAARKIESQTSESKKAEWSQQKELEAIARQREEMLNQVEQLAENMDKSLEEMQESSLMSREIMERLEEIRELFKEVATPEMIEAQRQLQEALKNMDPQELQEAMRNMEMSQEELLERLERTLALLKVMHIRQKIEAMVRQAEQLVERQAATNEEAETAENEALTELSQAEKQTREGLKQLETEAQNLDALLKEAELEQVPEARQFVDAVKENEADPNMQRMQEALKQSNREQAKKEGSQAQSKLSEMLDQMQQMQMAMNNSDDKALERAMLRAIDHANHLSQDQEALLKSAQELDPRSVVIRDLAGSQQDLAQSCSGLLELVRQLGRQSPFLGMEVHSLVNEAIQEMDLAKLSLTEKQGIGAMSAQHEAMFNLNRAATRLMESLDQHQQCNKPRNENMDFNKMQSLCQKQNQLNQQTQQQCNKPGQCDNKRPGEQGQQSMPGPDPQSRREGMERLAAEQGAIRKSLQELEDEFGGSRQVLGRLSDIASEMEKVEESLRSGEAGPETAERQLRIYSRMLEATRSLQRKDYSDQRRASSASAQPVYLPPSLQQGLFDDDVKLEDRLRRFLGDSYPPQYEEQIKAYFKALLKADSDARNEEAITQ